MSRLLQILAQIMEKLDYESVYFFFVVIHLGCNIFEKPCRMPGKITLRIDNSHWNL